MSEELMLVVPQKNHEDGWRLFLSEMKERGERIIPYAARVGDGSYESFLEVIETSRKQECIPKEFVPSDTYFLTDKSQSVVYGVVSIRHSLNDNLLNYGGHVGYGVAPSHRRKGYATIMLSLALEKCRELGLERVLVTCDKDNIGSARTIEKNGGIQEDERTEASGNIIKRYWIAL